MKQCQVLLVDDDRDYLEIVGEIFSTLSGRTWRLHLANSAEEALAMLKDTPMDLAVVDVQMPVLDGVQLVGLLQRRYPNLKRAILTGYASEGRRVASLANGADLFIEKPSSPDGLKTVFVMLEELLAGTANDGFQGVLRRVGLSDVIQMECLARNSSILEIYNQHVIGRIYIEDGQIVHAAGGELEGEKALQKLLSLPGGSFELAQFEAPPRQTLSGSWEFLLMEAARMRDELAASENADGLEVDPETLAARADSSASCLEETLICSASGETIYEAQCANVPARIGWLQSVSEQASWLGNLISLGDFDRLEMKLESGRAVVLSRAPQMVYVRVSNSLGNA